MPETPRESERDLTAYFLAVTAERSLVSPEPMTGCWLWTGHRAKDGYGVVSIRNHPYRAHRLSLFAALGLRFAKNSPVLHSCDVRACVNPDHLRLGTAADNKADQMARGRILRGECHPSRKLNRAQVDELRALRLKGWTAKRLGDKFGITPTQACRIWLGKKYV
jgi:hypothetical protein